MSGTLSRHTHTHVLNHIVEIIYSYTHILIHMYSCTHVLNHIVKLILNLTHYDPINSILPAFLVSLKCRGQICQHLLPYDDLVGGRFQSWVGTSYLTKIDTKQNDLQVSFSISRTPETSSHFSGSQTDIHLC